MNVDLVGRVAVGTVFLAGAFVGWNETSPFLAAFGVYEFIRGIFVIKGIRDARHADRNRKTI